MRIEQNTAWEVSHDRGSVLVRKGIHTESGRQCCFVHRTLPRCERYGRGNEGNLVGEAGGSCGPMTKASDIVVSGRCCWSKCRQIGIVVAGACIFVLRGLTIDLFSGQESDSPHVHQVRWRKNGTTKISPADLTHGQGASITVPPRCAKPPATSLRNIRIWAVLINDTIRSQILKRPHDILQELNPSSPSRVALCLYRSVALG